VPVRLQNFLWPWQRAWSVPELIEPTLLNREKGVSTTLMHQDPSMAISYDCTQVGLPTDKLEDEYSAKNARYAELEAQRTLDPENDRILCEMFAIHREIEGLIRQIALRTTGVATLVL